MEKSPLSSEVILGSPFPEYILDWRLFRCLSNETKILSRTITESVLFDYAKSNGCNIYDIGTGDGELIKRICPFYKNKFYLIDPSSQWLSLAREALLGQDNVEFIEKKFAHGLIAPNSLCLAVHVVYLLDKKEIDEILKLPNLDIRVILVLDAHDSVFSALWKRTAPTFLDKCKYTHERINKLYRGRAKIDEVETRVVKPSIEMEDKIRESLLSTMCYNKFSKMTKEMQNEAIEIIEHHSSKDRKSVVCKSIQYNLGSWL